MVDDKYIGLVLSLSGSVAIGTSFIITKKVTSPFLPFYFDNNHALFVVGPERCGRAVIRFSGFG